MTRQCILYLLILLLSAGCTLRGSSTQSTASTNSITLGFHLYSPDGYLVAPSSLRKNPDGSIAYAYSDPGQWSVLISEKPSNASGEKVFTVPTASDIREWAKIGVDIKHFNVRGADAYVWQGLVSYSSLDMAEGGVDISIFSSASLDTKTLLEIARSLR